MGLSEILLINLLRASESKAQMVVPYYTVSATVLVTPLVTPSFWKQLSILGLCSASLEFDVSGLLWPRLPALTCFSKSWSESPHAEVPGLELILQQSLAPVYCLRVPSLRCAQNHRGPSSDLLSQRFQTHAQTSRDFRFLPIPFDVPAQCPDTQRS